MELTLDEALRRGIEAHQSGNIQEAERFYTAILKVDPRHPDANHNLGVLGVNVGQLERALGYFKTAVEVIPEVEQYWLSYIGNLLDLNHVEEANVVFDEARAKGFGGNPFDLKYSNSHMNFFKNLTVTATNFPDLSVLSM